MTKSDTWKKRLCVQRYWEYKDAVNLEAKRLGFELQESEMHIVFVMPMPKSWSKKKKEVMNGAPHKQKPDVDNLCKAFFDALASKDEWIWDVRLTKVWGKQPAIIVKAQNLTKNPYKP